MTDKKIKTTLVKESEIEVWDDESGSFVLNQPSKYMIQLATGDLLFIHTKSRSEAQDYVDKEYGKSFYLVKQVKQSAGSGTYSASGTTTRKCTGSWLRKS